MPAAPEALTREQITDFHRDGFVVVRGFYDADREIRPIQQDIYEIIGMVIEKHQLPIVRPAFAPETFDSGYHQVIAHNRALGGVIYDAVKQVPGFLRLTCNLRHDALFRDLRPGALPGVAAGGYGIRIDNPSEERFRADWHQDYPGQFRSLDGLTLWSPLVAVEESMGPVIFCLGSHQEGLFKLHSRDPNNPHKTGAYGLYLHDRDNLIARYPQVAPLTCPGDLVILDYQVLHASGYNISKRSRWSMQMRYFNFREPFGIKIDWKGSFAAGVSFRDIHPELLID